VIFTIAEDAAQGLREEPGLGARPLADRTHRRRRNGRSGGVSVHRNTQGVFSQQDTGRLNGTIMADQAISFQEMQQKIKRLAVIAKQDPGVDTVLTFTGGGGGTTTNTGRVFIALKPLAERAVPTPR